MQIAMKDVELKQQTIKNARIIVLAVFQELDKLLKLWNIYNKFKSDIEDIIWTNLIKM